MPIVKATAGGVQIDDGVYNATCLDIQETPATPNSLDASPWLKWTFTVHNGSPDGVEMSGGSSLRTGPKSKTRQWVEALLGRKMELDEELQTEEMLPRDCMVTIAHDEKGFAKIMGVLPPMKGPGEPGASGKKAASKGLPVKNTEVKLGVDLQEPDDVPF